MKNVILTLLVLFISASICLFIFSVNNPTEQIENNPVNSYEYISEVEGRIITKLTPIVRSEAYVEERT